MINHAWVTSNFLNKLLDNYAMILWPSRNYAGKLIKVWIILCLLLFVVHVCLLPCLKGTSRVWFFAILHALIWCIGTTRCGIFGSFFFSFGVCETSFQLSFGYGMIMWFHLIWLPFVWFGAYMNYVWNMNLVFVMELYCYAWCDGVFFVGNM